VNGNYYNPIVKATEYSIDRGFLMAPNLSGAVGRMQSRGGTQKLIFHKPGMCESMWQSKRARRNTAAI